MKKKIGLMLLGVLVVSQVSVLAYTEIGNGTRGTAYGTVYAGETVNKAMTNYTLANMNANGVARLYVPGVGNIDRVATRTSTKASATYTYNGSSAAGDHRHYYTDGLVN